MAQASRTPTEADTPRGCRPLLVVLVRAGVPGGLRPSWPRAWSQPSWPVPPSSRERLLGRSGLLGDAPSWPGRLLGRSGLLGRRPSLPVPPSSRDGLLGRCRLLGRSRLLGDAPSSPVPPSWPEPPSSRSGLLGRRRLLARRPSWPVQPSWPGLLGGCAFLAGAAFLAPAAAALVAVPAAARAPATAALGSERGFFTTSLNAEPARNLGTTVFLIFTLAPVRGLRPVRAARAACSNVPKPVMATLPPLATSRMITSTTAVSASLAALRLPRRLSSSLISSALFTSSPPQGW